MKNTINDYPHITFHSIMSGDTLPCSATHSVEEELLVTLDGAHYVRREQELGEDEKITVEWRKLAQNDLNAASAIVFGIRAIDRTLPKDRVVESDGFTVTIQFSEDSEEEYYEFEGFLKDYGKETRTILRCIGLYVSDKKDMPLFTGVEGKGTGTESILSTKTLDVMLFSDGCTNEKLLELRDEFLGDVLEAEKNGFPDVGTADPALTYGYELTMLNTIHKAILRRIEEGKWINPKAAPVIE